MKSSKSIIKHLPKCECFYCNHTEEEINQFHTEAMQRDGFWIDYTYNDCKCPQHTNINTNGLPQSLSHPDLQICFNISPNLAGWFLHTLVDEIKRGVKFESGKKYDDIFSYPVEFIDAFERDRTVLRLLIPDKNGKYDGPFADQLTMLEYL